MLHAGSMMLRVSLQLEQIVRLRALSLPLRRQSRALMVRYETDVTRWYVHAE